MIYFPKKLIVTLVLSLLTGITIAQDNVPMVVKINYSCLDFETINNKELVKVRFADLLNAKGMKELKELAGSYGGIGQFEMYKLFPFLTTKDTLSVSRTGKLISVPPFWATFQMQVPKNVDYVRLMLDLDKRTKFIDYAHPEFAVEPTSVPNDSLYYKQYSLNGAMPNADINMEEAWEIETGEPFIKVAVHDNGIDTLHPDIDVLFGGGYVSGQLNPESAWGGFGYHGTPVAGIIGATRSNDSTGIAGVAGGDGSDSSGVSLVDIKYGFGSSAASRFMAGVVDAARSSGSYWNYPDISAYTTNSGYFDHAPGFGVQIGNHSYIIKTELPALLEGKSGDTGNSTVVADCQICREAFLFSLKSGVINVVARGNNGSASPSTDPQYLVDLFPQNLPDSWIISVGASGYDGVTVQDGLNQSTTEAPFANGHYYSLYGGNMDIIAPGSDTVVYTIGTGISSGSTVSDEIFYQSFNGTSAAAPHVSGVVGLLLSHYNRDCYNNRNLSIEDVEYILENSATDLYGPGYDDTTGWGRLDAGAALKMIEHPIKQIVHPNVLLSSGIPTKK